MWPLGIATYPNQMRALSEQELVERANKTWADLQQASYDPQMRYNCFLNANTPPRPWVEYDERLGYCYEVK